jgi:alpha-galactosidase
MSDALNSTGRDIVFSLSNSATLKLAPEYAKYANSWRMTGDIIDTYESLGENAFSTTGWIPYGGPGHWNDPDMMVLGEVGWGNIRPTGLTPDEQYTHMSLWCLLSAPLILGCDITQMDPFTLSLLDNDEVLAVDQDELGKSASPVYVSDDKVTLTGRRPYARRGVMNTVTLPRLQVWAKPMSDGSYAVGLFNLGDSDSPVTLQFSVIKLDGELKVRDLWRQKDLGKFTGSFTATVPSHGVVLVKIKK